MAHGQFRKGWRENDIEDCARMMVTSILTSHCCFNEHLFSFSELTIVKLVLTKDYWIKSCSTLFL